MSEEKREDDLVKVGLPGGISVQARGTIALVVILLTVSTGAILYAMQIREVEAKEQLRIHDAGTVARAATINGKIDNLSQRVEEVSYILTLSDAQRKALNLDMPESLRQKVRR